MSYDIILLKPDDLDIDDLQDLDEVHEIGSESFVLDALNAVFPGCIDGFFAHGEAYTVEGSLCGQPVTSTSGNAFTSGLANRYPCINSTPSPDRASHSAWVSMPSATSVIA